MYLLDPTRLKLTSTTHAVPLAAMAAAAPLDRPPAIGDLVIAEVVELRRHTSIETREGVRLNIYPGDVIVGAFGNRYATDQYEGYVPEGAVEICDILSMGGVLGEVRSKAVGMKSPTKVRVLGSVRDGDGRPLRLQQFGLRPVAQRGKHRPEVILSIGASMNSGKTTTLGTTARALVSAGFRVAAAKITGTATSKDPRFYLSNGANPVLDFTDAGFPSTYMLELDQLLMTYHALVSHLRVTRPDYILIEIADGIFQRETKMLLNAPEFRSQVDHVFFSAPDSLSAAQAVRSLAEWELPLRAIVGTITKSPLMMREAEEVTGVRCLTLSAMLDGGVLDAVGAKPRVQSHAGLERATLGLAFLPAAAQASQPVGGQNGTNGVHGKNGTNGAAHLPHDEMSEHGADARALAPTLN